MTLPSVNSSGELHLVPHTGPEDLDRATAAAATFLAALGVDVESDQLKGTPGRMARAYAELLTPAPFDVTMFDQPNGYDGLVTVRGVRFASLCEHHALPFMGTADVGYLPGAKIVGLSKLARAVEMVSRNPQLQERMTVQIADWLEEELCPEGVGVRIQAEHMCMNLRGARANGVRTVTSVLRGQMRDNPVIRNEWMTGANTALG